MNVLLDTNILSEAQKPVPDRNVIDWLDAIDEDRVYMSVASIAEIRRGVMLLPAGRRRDVLAAWLDEDLPGRFGDRVLPIDRAVAAEWGNLMATSRRKGVGLSAMDAFFAATARAYDLTLATRNTKDFAAFDVRLHDPWIAS